MLFSSVIVILLFGKLVGVVVVVTGIISSSSIGSIGSIDNTTDIGSIISTNSTTNTTTTAVAAVAAAITTTIATPPSILLPPPSSDGDDDKQCPLLGATCGSCLTNQDCGHYCSSLGGYIHWCSSTPCPTPVHELDIITCPIGQVSCSECVKKGFVFQSLISSSGTIASWCTTIETAATSCTRSLRPSALNWCASNEPQCEQIKEIVTPLLVNKDEAGITSNGARMIPGCLDYAYSGCTHCLSIPGCSWAVSTMDDAQACMSKSMCKGDKENDCINIQKGCPKEIVVNRASIGGGQPSILTIILGLMATILC